jgi:hypothetical protein
VWNKWFDKSWINQILGQFFRELFMTLQAPLANHPMFFDAQRSSVKLSLANCPDRFSAPVGQFSGT